MTSEYDVRCPRCRSKAVAIMKPDGVKGTYREAMIRQVAERLLCPACGFNRTSLDEPLEYELWYKTEIHGNVLWAVNLAHLQFLIRWLSGAIASTALSAGDRAYVEALPKWMINSQARSGMIKKLEKLAEQ